MIIHILSVSTCLTRRTLSLKHHEDTGVSGLLNSLNLNSLKLPELIKVNTN